MSATQSIDADGRLDPSAAIYLMLSMTKRCNMRCPGCYYLQQDEDFFENRDIGLEDAREIVKYYRDAGVRRAVPNAEGDVLLHPEYADLVGYINKLDFPMKPWLVTNGIQLPKLADFIVRSVDEVLVSVDGPDHEKYNAYRGGNKALFDKVMAGLRAVTAAARKYNPRPEIIINCVMTADRVGDMPAMIRLAEKMRVDTIKFTNYHVAGEDEDKEPLTADDPEVLEVLKRITERDDYKINIFLPSLYGDIAPPFQCKMLSSIMIGSNGDYSPCCRIIPEPRWGNYYTSTDKHNNEALRNFRLSVLNAPDRDSLPPICRQCAHLSPRRLAFLTQKKNWIATNLS